VKVPTYRRQLQRTDRTGAGYLTAQVNPNVMALAGQGLASAGQTMFNFGADMLEVETKKQQLADKNEAALAVTELDSQLLDLYLESTQLANTNPHEAQRHYEIKSQALYERARPNLSKNSLALFQLHAQEKLINRKGTFNKENLNRINDFTKNITDVQLQDAIKDASNTDMPYNDRIQNIFKITGKNAVDTTNFDFTPIPTHYDDKDVNILKYHRERIANGTYLENTDGSTTTIYITGVKHPENGRIYMFPGYWEGEKHTEEEVFNKANEEGWWDMYPSDSNNADHKKRVKRLKLFINNDGKKLAKMEKEITTGLNMKLVDEQIISISEAITSNREAFNKIASNTITSLIQSAPDANAIALGITDGFITDPILRMIWPELNPNEKQELTKNAMDFAKKIETQRKEADEEKENKLEEYLKDIDIKRINSEDLKERTNLTNQLSNANYWQSTEAKEEAYEELEELSNAGKISFAEKSSIEVLDSLETLNELNQLTLAAINKQKQFLTKEDYLRYRAALRQEANEGTVKSKALFKSRFKFEAGKAVSDSYTAEAVNAYQLSVYALDDYLIENANATYSEIVTKAKSIIKEQESTFKEMLEISYIEDFITLEKRAGNLPINELDPIKSIMDAVKSDPSLFPKFADSLSKMKTYKIEGIGPYK
tara:strand:+ start:2726 stop:4699 length:1974 start_codon:yes stop_codon:yes gene_type:complete